jgi:hypothetical protein
VRVRAFCCRKGTLVIASLRTYIVKVAGWTSGSGCNGRLKVEAAIAGTWYGFDRLGRPIANIVVLSQVSSLRRALLCKHASQAAIFNSRDHMEQCWIPGKVVHRFLSASSAQLHTFEQPYHRLTHLDARSSSKMHLTRSRSLTAYIGFSSTNDNRRLLPLFGDMGVSFQIERLSDWYTLKRRTYKIGHTAVAPQKYWITCRSAWQLTASSYM